MNLAAIEKRSPTHTAPTQCASPPLVTGSSTSCPHFPTHPAPSPHTSSHLQDPVVLCRLLVHHNDRLRRHRRRLAVLQRGRGLGRPFFLLGLRTARAKQRHVRGGSPGNWVEQPTPMITPFSNRWHRSEPAVRTPQFPHIHPHLVLLVVLDVLLRGRVAFEQQLLAIHLAKKCEHYGV